MGDILAKFRSDLVLVVKTGDRKGAGTDANVYAVIEDVHGNQNVETKLDNWLRNDHERNSSGVYSLPSESKSQRHAIKCGQSESEAPAAAAPLGEPAFLILWRDRSGFADDWFVERVELRTRSSKEVLAIWPLHRWIKADKKYRFAVNDCLLPQKDTSTSQRLEELRERRGLFELSQNLEGAPPQCRCPPLAICPPDAWKRVTIPVFWLIQSALHTVNDTIMSQGCEGTVVILKRELTSLRTRMEHKLIAGSTAAWCSLDDLKNIYKLGFQEPSAIHRWKCDMWFGAQRLQGINPLAIKLCTQLPECLSDGRNGAQMSLDRAEIQRAMKAKKLFIVDHKVLRNLPCRDDRMVVAPVGLFGINSRGELQPLAIHLFPDAAADNPLFSPSDPPYTWMLAKMFFNMADAMIHRSWLWFGLCHLLPESIWVSANRCLSSSHPIYKLLEPHLGPVIRANSHLQRELMSPGGWMDSTTMVGMRGLQALIGRMFEDFHIIDDLDIRTVITRNETGDEALEDYPFREDAIQIQDAIREYVCAVIENHYHHPSDIAEDSELSGWLDEMSRSRRKGGCQIKGIPSPIDSDVLIGLLTNILSLASLFNAAYGAGQYDELAFPPNYPSAMKGTIPRNNHPRTERELVSQLPSKEATLSWLSVVRFLSTKPSHRFGSTSGVHLSHPVDVEALQKLQQRLSQISQTIKKRNETRKFAYTSLDPENIPDAIEI